MHLIADFSLPLNVGNENTPTVFSILDVYMARYTRYRPSSTSISMIGGVACENAV
jgi:hypothetical protein